MQEHNLKDEHELQSYFIKRIQGFLNSKGKEIIGWDEILEGGLTKGAVVQSWRGMEGGIAAARQGNKVIMSPTSHAYLDYDLKSIDLKKIYNFNPIPQGLEIENRSYIIGAECNIWTEHVPDEKTLDQKVFPRMIGMSEALWSDEKKDYKDFNRRIQSHYPILEFYKVQYGEEEIPFSYQTKIQNDSLYLVLTAASDQLTLNYNYKNDTNSLVYDTPILLNSSESINVQAYKNNQRYGEKNEIPLSKHKALNSQVSYASAFNKWYTAGGENALVDGKLGTLDFKDGNWQGFWGTDVDISIQLKPHQKISNLSLNFYQYNNSWIFIPLEVQVESTVDGINWERFGSSKSKSSPSKRGKFIEEMLVKNTGNAINLKSLRIKIKNIGKVPDWHEAAGSDARIFIDEIQVK